MCLFSPKKLVVLVKSSEEPNRCEILGTYCVGWFCFVYSWGRFLTDLWLKGAPTNLWKWWREVLDIFENKLSMCNSLFLKKMFTVIMNLDDDFFPLWLLLYLFPFNILFILLSLSTWWISWKCYCGIIFLKLGWEQSCWWSWSSLVKKVLDDFGLTYSSSVNTPTQLVCLC